jgi:regulator of sigma E protease
MIYVITLIIFIILLSFLIIIHEWGHMYVALKRGVIVQSFAIGFGPKLFSFTKNGVEYRINILPFGGYVSLFGDDDPTKKLKGSLSAATPLTKFLITIAGVFMNFIFAVIALFVFLIFINFKFYYSNIIPNFHFTFGTNINNVLFSPIPHNKTSSLSKDHVKPGVYIINRVNNVNINSISQLENIVSKNKGKYLKFNYSNVNNLSLFGISIGKSYNKEFLSRKSYPKNSGPVGISIEKISHIEFNSILSKIGALVTFPYDVLQLTFQGFSYLIHESIKQNNSKILTSQVAGPVGIYMYTNILFQNDGLVGIIFIFGIISLSLSIMNLLPIPPLDGFYVLLAILEGVFSIKINDKLMYYLSMIGVVFFIILMILVTLNDLINFKII